MRFACLQHQQNQTIYNSESVDQNVSSEPVFLHNQQNFVLTPRLQSFSSFWMIFETLLSKNIIGDKDKKLWDQDWSFYKHTYISRLLFKMSPFIEIFNEHAEEIPKN